MEEYLKQNPNIHCLECNSEKINYISITFAIFICDNCYKNYSNFKKNQLIKNINDEFDTHEIILIKKVGNERFLNLIKKYKISLKQN